MNQASAWGLGTVLMAVYFLQKSPLQGGLLALSHLEEVLEDKDPRVVLVVFALWEQRRERPCRDDRVGHLHQPALPFSLVDCSQTIEKFKSPLSMRKNSEPAQICM